LFQLCPYPGQQTSLEVQQTIPPGGMLLSSSRSATQVRFPAVQPTFSFLHSQPPSSVTAQYMSDPSQNPPHFCELAM